MAKSPEYPVEVNVDKQRTYVRGEEAKLTPKEFHVLLLLAERGGKITSRQDILGHVWKRKVEDFDLDSRTVDQHVARLRRKLGRSGDVIETVTGAGYRTEKVKITREKYRIAHVERIVKRYFSPEPCVRFIVEVRGDAMTDLRAGHTFPVAA